MRNAETNVDSENDEAEWKQVLRGSVSTGTEEESNIGRVSAA
jgi:hypothetical protein